MERATLRSPWVLLSLAMAVLLALTGVGIVVGALDGPARPGRVVTGVVLALLGGGLAVRVAQVRVVLDDAGVTVHRVLRAAHRVPRGSVASVVRIGADGRVPVTQVKLRLLRHDGDAVDLPMLAGFAGRSFHNARVERQQQVLRAHLLPA